MKDCLALEENVICKFGFDDRNLDGRTFNIKLLKEDGIVKAQLLANGKSIAAEYLGIDKIQYTDFASKEKGTDADSADIIVSYSDGKPNVEKMFAMASNSRTELSKKIILYKSNGIKFIDETEENSFGAPIKTVFLPRYKGMKLCVDAGKQVYAYDASDNQVKRRDLVYRFAITFTTPPIFDRCEKPFHA